MKKTISLLLLLVLLLAFASCSGKNKLYVVELPLTAASENRFAGIEIDGFDYERITDDSVQKTRQITVDGLEYTCVYQYTEISPYYKCSCDVYCAEGNNGFACKIKLNKETGGVVMYSYGFENGYVTKKGDKSYEDCKKIAEETAKRNTGTRDLVFVEKSADKEPKNDEKHGDVYEFTFVRMIGGFKTNIEIKVGVNTDGWAYSCDMGANQSYDGLFVDRGFMHNPDESDSKTIDKKIKSVYKSQKKNIKWEITDRYFAKLKDGTFGMIYDIAVTTENGAVETVKLFKPDKKHT